VSKSKKNCWKAFAEYIRLRDAPDGYGMCISCNKPIPYPNGTGAWHAGHFYPRSTTYAALYFHEKNTNGQCRHCNTYLEGNTEMYRRGLIQKYGEGVIEELDVIKAMGSRKMLSIEYDEMAKHYRKLSKEIKAQRGLE